MSSKRSDTPARFAPGDGPPPEPLLHVWHRCHECGAQPIIGRRYECQTCPAGPDRDLCEGCHVKYRAGEIVHPAGGSGPRGHSSKSHTFRVREGQPRSGYDAWLTIPHRSSPEPAIPARFVVRPEFRSGFESFLAGYAFAVETGTGQPPLLLTALHVLDPLIKEKGIDCTELNQSYTGRELPGVVSGVELYDVFAANWMLHPLGNAGPMLVLPHARIDDPEPWSYRDIAAFRLPRHHELHPARLATKPPQSGEVVWLAARLEPRSRGRLRIGVVVEATDRTLVFRFEKRDEHPAYTSGAPLVNSRGEVVAINVGGGRLDGANFGHGNHVGNIRWHLEQAMSSRES